MIWWQISFLLSLHGFFKEYRPSEPFISPYLKGEWKNFTSEQVYQEIYPLGTYLTLAVLVFVFLLTDLLRYKPVIVVGGLSAVTCWTLIRFGTTISHMQLVEFFYALFMASEVAYYTYIYAKVDQSHYQKVTSHTRAAFLLGKASAGLSSQLFVMYNVFDYEELNYLTVAGVGIATICGILLPPVTTSMYFHRKPAGENTRLEALVSNGDDHEALKISETPRHKYVTAFHHLFKDFIHAFTNKYVLKWSIWWALATCGYLQVTSYSQLLWEEINIDGKETLYNGFVEFSYSLLAAAVAFAVGFAQLPWSSLGEFFLAFISLIQGGLLIASAYADNLLFAYAVYILYGLLYQSAITIASSEVAKHIHEDSYALVFGVNTFLALAIQTVLTVIVINALNTVIRTQFVVYGGYYLVIGVGFAIAGAIIFLRRKS